MLRLLDARTGSYAEVRSARRGLLRICAHVPETAGGADLTGLRVLLVADLLARTAETRDLQVLTALVSEDQGPGPSAALDRAADALNIHPAAMRATARDAEAALGGAIDVHLIGHAAAADGDRSGLVACVGAAFLREAGGLDEVAGDPLAVRLALLSFPYHQPDDLTAEALACAGRELGHWRRQVAGWAQSPSRPTPVPIAEQVWEACGDLDMPSVLALLRGLIPDADVPPGAKFETFVSADRILGLDLPRDIGRAD